MEYSRKVFPEKFQIGADSKYQLGRLINDQIQSYNHTQRKYPIKRPGLS